MTTQTILNTPPEVCNACGGLEHDHHFVQDTQDVYGAHIWVYGDEYVHVFPWLTTHGFREYHTER